MGDPLCGAPLARKRPACGLFQPALAPFEPSHQIRHLEKTLVVDFSPIETSNGGGGIVSPSGRIWLLAVITPLVVPLAARAENCISILPTASHSRCQIAIPPFPGGGGERPARPRRSPAWCRTICRAPGLFQRLDPKSFIQNVRGGRAASNSALGGRSMRRRLSTGEVPDPADGKAPGRGPPVGCPRRAAASRLRLQHDAAELAPHRPYHCRPGSAQSASPARTAISTPASVYVAGSGPAQNRIRSGS